jgi:hypothetical protein
MGRWTSGRIDVPATVQNDQNVQKATTNNPYTTDGIPFGPFGPFGRPRGDIEIDAGVPTATPFAEAPTALQALQPQGVDEFRWREALNDGRRFLETWGSQAANFGWTSDDLFGLHPTAPLARYDAMGLVWLLRGRTVERLTATEAAIRASAGTTFSFRRVLS